jgi:hypothetical protein
MENLSRFNLGGPEVDMTFSWMQRDAPSPNGFAGTHFYTSFIGGIDLY